MEDLFKFVLRITRGNPGAIEFVASSLSDAQKAGDAEMERWLVAMQRAGVLGIGGAGLYTVWNDHCGRDNKLAIAHLDAATLIKMSGEGE